MLKDTWGLEKYLEWVNRLRKSFGLPPVDPIKGSAEYYEHKETEKKRQLEAANDTGKLLGVARPYKKPRSRGIPRTTREKLFKRDKCICQICGRRFPEQDLVPNHIDHNRGRNVMSNLETTCAGCNMQEGMIYARLLREAGPRSLVAENERLRIVEEARRITKEQAPRRRPR